MFRNRLACVPFGSACLLLLLASRGEAGASSEAYVGEPFGVGRVTIDVLRGEPLLPLSDERFTILEADGRVFYPVLKQEPVRKLIRGLLDIDAPRKVSIYFLFRGDQPFDLSAFTPNEQGVRVKPLSNSSQHSALLSEWWQQHAKRYESLLKDRAYPPVAENFLLASLSRRLQLPIPEPRGGLLGLKAADKQESALSSLMIGETQQLDIDRAMLLQVSPEQLVMRPLPEAIAWPEVEVADGELTEVPVEPMAGVVPAECFYLRFGSFSNYWWFRSLQKKWQGDLGNMILRRGIQQGAADRVQQQLSLYETALTGILGPQVITDAAIIGFDPYVAQGGAIGILLQSKNDLLLSADLTRQRRNSLTKFEDAKEEKIELAGQEVSLISTPDGKVRSYYASHENFHLVTTSRTMAERFLQAAQGERSLASLTSFRLAREQFPLEREDTMFAFVSEAFWQHLSAPNYFIENLRRQRSVRESLLLELARHAARCEGTPVFAKEEFIAAGILPQGFATRVDGSELLEAETGTVDSLRGRRGFYRPIADMVVADVTAEEAQAYELFGGRVKQESGLLPPMAVAVKRSSQAESKTENIAIDVAVQGSMRKRLGKVARFVGQPARQRMQYVEGDVLSFEAVVEFPAALANGESVEHHLFGALRDYRAPLAVKQGAIQPDAEVTELVRGYLGAWPKPGILSWLTKSEEEPGPVPEQVGAQMWQAKQEDFLLLSFKPEVIQQVLPQLATQPAEREAQAWLRLEDLTGTKMAENVTALGYMRTRETSVAGSRMMNSLANLLQVPRNECKAVAERLIDGKFVCPLGGDYRLYATDRGLEVWISSALPKANQFLLTEVPEDYELPLLRWFRGLEGDVTLGEDSLGAHFEILMTEDAMP